MRVALDVELEIHETDGYHHQQASQNRSSQIPCDEKVGEFRACYFNIYDTLISSRRSKYRFS